MQEANTKSKKGDICRHVLAAKNIRKELKFAFPELSCKVKSSSFSMGNAVDVFIDADYETRQKVESLIKKYEYGTYDGLNDCQGYVDDENNNFRSVYGSAKYISVNAA